MGWTDSHLHEFQLPKGGPLFLPKYALDELDDGNAEDESGVVFHEVCARVKDRLMYTYDFGDFDPEEFDLSEVNRGIFAVFGG